MTPITWMALGTFAIGGEGFMIASLLPSPAGHLKVSVAAAGPLVTVFALTYAFSPPILTALTGALNRRLPVLSMTAFALPRALFRPRPSEGMDRRRYRAVRRRQARRALECSSGRGDRGGIRQGSPMFGDRFCARQGGRCRTPFEAAFGRGTLLL
jgi:hypothetical protein